MAGPSIMGRLGLDGRGFQMGLKKAQGEINSFAHEVKRDLKLAMAGLFGYEAWKVLAERVFEAGAKIKDLSEQLNVSTDTVQLWGKAAARTGLSADDFGSAMLRMDVAMSAALDKDQGKLDIFNRLGVSLEQLRSGDKPGIIKTIAANMDKAAASSNDFREMFGKTGARLMESFRVLNDISEKFKPPFSEEDLERMHQAEIQFKRISLAYQGAASGPLGGAMGFGANVIEELTGARKDENNVSSLIKKALKLRERNEFGTDQMDNADTRILRQQFDDYITKSKFGDERSRGASFNSMIETAKRLGIKLPENAGEILRKEKSTESEKTSKEETGALKEASPGKVKEAEEHNRKMQQEIEALAYKGGLIGKTTSQRIDEIDRRKGALYADIFEEENQPENKLYGKKSPLRKEIAQLENERMQLVHSNAHLPESDAMARIGGLGGSGSSEVVSTQKNILSTLRTHGQMFRDGIKVKLKED